LGGVAPLARKPRKGVAGSGPSGDATSTFSQINHAAARKFGYSTKIRHRITEVLRGASKKIPVIGGVVMAYEIYDLIECKND